MGLSLCTYLLTLVSFMLLEPFSFGSPALSTTYVGLTSLRDSGRPNWSAPTFEYSLISVSQGRLLFNNSFSVLRYIPSGWKGIYLCRWPVKISVPSQPLTRFEFHGGCGLILSIGLPGFHLVAPLEATSKTLLLDSGVKSYFPESGIQPLVLNKPIERAKLIIRNRERIFFFLPTGGCRLAAC